MKSSFKILVLALAAVATMSWPLLSQQDSQIPKVVKGYPQQNLIIPVKDLSKATVVIDNRQIVIDGIWNFKGADGKVLTTPEIVSQPRTLTDKLLLAARAVGETIVTITEDNEKTIYNVKVLSREPPPRQRSTASMTIEASLEKLIGIPTVKVTVLDASSDFLTEAASNAMLSQNTTSAPTTTTATQNNNSSQSASAPSQQTTGSVQTSLPTFQPTIILEGEVNDDLDLRRALSLARAFSNNILNFIQVANPLQVRIKIQVVSVTLGNDSEIGLEYQGSDTNALGFRTKFGVDTHPRKLLDFHYPFFNIARVGGGNDFSVFLSLIKNKSKVKILQEPTLTILNGQSGHFRVGGMFPVNRRTIDASGAILITTEYRPFGISLLVTPLAALPTTVPGNVWAVGDDNLVLGVPPSGIPADQNMPGISNGISPSIEKNGVVKLYVRPSISSLDFTRVDLDPVNHPDPIINERLVETRVAMKDKESLIIGGLFDENFREAMRSVPFIEKVPILGELFKNRTNSGERTELVFILTPTIVGRQQMEEGDYPQLRLPEANQYFKEVGVTTMASKPTRISASEVMPRREEMEVEQKPEPKIIEPTPAPEPIPNPIKDAPQEGAKPVEPKPEVETEPVVYKAVDSQAEPLGSAKVEEKPAATEEKVAAAPAEEKPVEQKAASEEKTPEFIPVNSFTPVDSNSPEAQTDVKQPEAQKVEAIPAMPIEPSADVPQPQPAAEPVQDAQNPAPTTQEVQDVKKEIETALAEEAKKAEENPQPEPTATTDSSTPAPAPDSTATPTPQPETAPVNAENPPEP